MQTVLFLAEGFGQIQDRLLRGDVTRHGNDRARAFGGFVELCDLLELFLASSNYVDLVNLSDEAMYLYEALLTLAPFTAKAWVHMSPIPVAPPVTTATRPSIENRFLAKIWLAVLRADFSTLTRSLWSLTYAPGPDMLFGCWWRMVVEKKVGKMITLFVMTRLSILGLSSH